MTAQPGAEPDAALVMTLVQAMAATNPDYYEDLLRYARAAIAAMQPALSAAREAGRREGLEQAALACEAIRSDRIYGVEGHIASVCADAVRALVTPEVQP